MVKKTVKAKTKELFQEFMKKNGYGVYNHGFTHSHYAIRQPKKNEKIHDYYVDDLLDTNIDNISNTSVFFNFMKEVLNQGEHEVGLYQAIKKTPGVKNYSYDIHVSAILNALQPYKKTLFEYVTRPKFLENSWRSIEHVFETLDSQEHRVAIIEAMMQTKTFSALDTQKNIYNIVQKHIKNPSQFESQFNRINKVKESQSVIDYIDTPSIVVIGFTAEKLIGANLNTEINSSGLVEYIRNTSNNFKERHQEDLHIINTFMDYNKETKQYTLNIICPQTCVELNKVVFEKMINDLSRLNKWQDIGEYNQEDSIRQIIRECRIIHLQETLENTLDIFKETVKKPKNKL